MFAKGSSSLVGYRPQGSSLDRHTYVFHSRTNLGFFRPEAQVSRADECRLLYLSHGSFYTSPPIVTFQPFGFTRLTDTNLGCPRACTLWKGSSPCVSRICMDI
ncbi:hypothetical protein FOCG_03969 [Fusarium oxysporum f. sp. radicis-lycopersici 26381]|nr:hypothetical protein FOCG_03969 [Fusarium oxysporum f. sp. radicis-lycopersici 26381]